MPILIDGDKVITESDLVSWYVAEKYKTGTQLIPEDAYDKLRLRWFVQNSSRFIGAFYGFKGFGNKTKEDQDKNLNKITKILG